MFAEDEARLLIETAADSRTLSGMVRRRADGEPLEHILGWAEFCGHRVRVGPGVFVPRRRSEFLARCATAALPRPPSLAVDLCCGAGAIGLVLAARGATVHAADLDPAAVACARRNLEPAGARVHQGDLFQALPADLRGRIDVLVANVPYVPTADVALLPAEARLHEPLAALDGGTDGLDLLRRVAVEAPGWLAPGGTLLMETSRAQSGRAMAALRAAGWEPCLAADDDLGATTVIGTPGRRPATWR